MSIASPASPSEPVVRFDLRGAQTLARRSSVVGFGVRVLQTAHELARPREVRVQLVATLFGRASNVLMVAFAALLCGLATFVRTREPVALVFTGVEVSLLLARCVMILRFKSRFRAGLLVEVDHWLVGFGFAAIASSALWGLLCFACLAWSHDPVLYVVPVLSTVGTAGAVAARNSGVPRLAQLQLFCSLIPIILGSMLADDRGYALLALLTPAMMIGLLILVAERNQQLVALIVSERELARLSQTDPLTEVANRRRFGECLSRAWRQADVIGRPFAVLLFDVDHFKAFNDRHGHPIGDSCLQSIARILETSLRSEGDVVARYGGEEFAVLLQDIDRAGAIAAAERLRVRVEQAAIAHDTRGDGTTVVTISCGVASSDDVHAEAESLVKAADDALYRAKRLGRNLVEGPERLPSGRVAA